jgi:HK97 family phage major capsid protein
MDELKELNQKRSAAELREKFASHTVLAKVGKENREKAEEWRSSTEYREQFLGYLKGGRAPEQREIISTASSSILIPKLYEDGILKYLDANTVVRNLADIRTGVQGYPTLRYNNLETAGYTSAWTQPDTGTTARTSIDPGFTEVPIAPVPCIPFTQVSQQLIRQANFDIEAEVMDTLQRQLSKNLEWGYVGGTGTNSPTGIFTVNANVNIVSDTSTGTTRALAVAKATVANLSKMRYEKLPAAYWGSAAWILPQDVYASIAGIVVNGVPIFVPSADAALVGAAPFTLMGLPVYVTEYLPAHVATATTGKNTIAVLGNIRDGFSVREWGGIGMIRDEITAASSARVIFQGMAFANSAFTRVKSLVQLQITNA